MAAVRESEPVTVLRLKVPKSGPGTRDTYEIARVYVERMKSAPDLFSHSTIGFGWAGFYSTNGEGTSWIRGHHANDSDEVKALFVAHALAAA